ncbi:MAG: rhodanese-like domain-containing protein [Bacilli bacterium]|nr:rhodanese-like domain-containing protein [Bacilli bacterium]
MNIDIKELNRLLRKGPLHLIDVRSHSKYSRGTINSARNIEVSELLYNYSKYLDKGEVYYLFCDSGLSSLRLTNILNSMGYTVYNISGGYQAYLLEK